jgi:hypothetical protein
MGGVGVGGGRWNDSPRARLEVPVVMEKEQFWPTSSLALESRDGSDWSANCHGRAHLGTGEPCPRI